ncbi:MAG: hypothetical protein HN519_01800 [Hellea sp.]|nr:hypothetical protein [Hellea sp.]
MNLPINLGLVSIRLRYSALHAAAIRMFVGLELQGEGRINSNLDLISEATLDVLPKSSMAVML